MIKLLLLSLLSQAQFATSTDYNPKEIKLGHITIEIPDSQDNQIMQQQNSYWTNYFSLNKNIPQPIMYQKLSPIEKSPKEDVKTLKSYKSFYYWGFWVINLNQ